METTDQNETGKETARKLRAEITDLLDNDGEALLAEAASQKVSSSDYCYSLERDCRGKD